MRSTRSTDESTQSKKRHTGSMRRTVMYAAVVAVVGLFLAGLSVSKTTTPVQAQTGQSQTSWHVNDEPLLYYHDAGKLFRQPLDSETDWGRSPAWWWRVRGGPNQSYSYYTYAIGGVADSDNVAWWPMGSRRGIQQIEVYIPHSSSRRSTAEVSYEIFQGNDDEIIIEINQRQYSGWISLGRFSFDGNGSREVNIRVADNKASPHYNRPIRNNYANSRIGISAVRMRCVSDCAQPPTISALQEIPGRPGFLDEDSMGVITPHEGGDGWAEAEFRVSPSSATVTARVKEADSNLSVRPLRSGSSWKLRIRAYTRTEPDEYTVEVTATNGSNSVTRDFSITVEHKKFKIESKRSGLFVNQHIIALRDFPTIDGGEVLRGDPGGIVAGEENLSHFGTSWIAEGAKVWDLGVRVSGNALVKRGVRLDNNAKVFGNARVFGNAQVAHTAHVAGNAWVYSFHPNRRTQVLNNARVFGSAQVHSGAKVSSNAWVFGKAKVEGYPHLVQVRGYAKVYGNKVQVKGIKHEVWVLRNARICGNAQVLGIERRVEVTHDAQISVGRITGGPIEQGARYGECPDPIPQPPTPPGN